MSETPFTVLLVEPQSWWREIVSTSLSRWPEYPLVAVATTGEDGLGRAMDLAPQAVIVAADLPDVDAATLAAALQGLAPAPRVLLLTDLIDEEALGWIHPLGVAGVVAKNTRISEHLPAALGELRAGRTFFPPELRPASTTR